jgi:hypothetical protein
MTPWRLPLLLAPPPPRRGALDTQITLTPVNHTNFWVSTEGLVVQTQGTNPGMLVNPAGAFNGGGQGNKALVELNVLTLRNRLLSTLNRLEFVVRKIRPEATLPGNTFFINMQVQAVPSPTWNGPLLGPDRIVIGDVQPLVDTFTTLVYAASAPMWTVGGAPGLGLNRNTAGPSLPLVGNLPSTATWFYGTLPDGGLPYQTETAPIYIMSGVSASGQTLSRTWVLASVAIFFNDGTAPVRIALA